MKYNTNKIERKWQRYWETKKLYNTKDNPPAGGAGENYMLLTEFSYPSGNLHIGHWYAFALPDIKARYLRMKGYNVLYPTGFDAFGLPAENAAIKHGIHPEKWTKKNIAYMTKQLKSMGATFDWSREVRTIDPGYYKWTQWMFLKFYEKGLAYRAKTSVNWCPKDKTVLANEQVVTRSISSGQVAVCERCGTEVVQRELSQWMFKITDFADDLIEGLKDLNWQETAKLGQINWIGRSEGTRIKFKVHSSQFIDTEPRTTNHELSTKFIETFTTRADTLFGASAVVISPELARGWINNGWQAPDEIIDYVNKALGKRELERQENREKTGVYTGIDAINPVNNDKIPVWVADYVLGHYGTGAVMMVPAHDQRDYEFAQKYNLPVKNVIVSNSGEMTSGKAFEDEGRLMNSGEFNGFTSEEGRRKITEALKKKGFGNFYRTYRLHDWILSRQRYWGVPIPIINCPKCGNVPVPEKDLPVKLPPLKDFKPSDDGRSPLAKAKTWLKVKCPKCGNIAERETDTMDTFVDSSWYFMRYTDPKNKKEFASKKKMANWLPVPMYVGGAEHTTMHLLYSRFFTKALHSLGYVDFSEPFLGRRNRGIILGPDGQKMSKSRGNVIDPDIEVKNYGADTVRMYLAFMGPYEQGGPWDPKGINGVSRFLNRIWNFVNRYDKKTKPNPGAAMLLNKAIKEIGDDIDGLNFNTGVSGHMKLLNELESHELSRKEYEVLLKLLAPFAPHISEELWFTVLKNKKSIHLEKWPEYDHKLSADEKIRLIIQVNGRVRDTLEVRRGLSESDAKKAAMESENVKKHLYSEVKKVIYVQDRVINFVL